MVGVIIPVYNRKKELQDAFNSLVQQTFKQFITIVVDDGSTDNPQEVVEAYRDKLQIAYIKIPENKGVANAREVGLQFAIQQNFEFIIFLDADDLLNPSAVQILKDEIQRSAADIVTSCIVAERYNEPTRVISSDNITWLHGKIYRVNFLTQHGIHFDTSLHTNEDMSFNVWAYSKTNKIMKLQQQCYFWRDVGASITRTDGETLFKCVSLDYMDAMWSVYKEVVDSVENVYHNYIITNVYNCYNAYQLGKYFGYDLTEYDEKLTIMMTHPKIWEGTVLSRMLEYAENAKSIHRVGKHFITSSETFVQWIKNHGGRVDWVEGADKL